MAGASEVSVPPASLLYPYGWEHGDQVLPAEDDGFSEELSLLEPFTLFGVPHRTAYVRPRPLPWAPQLSRLPAPHPPPPLSLCPPPPSQRGPGPPCCLTGDTMPLASAALTPTRSAPTGWCPLGSRWPCLPLRPFPWRRARPSWLPFGLMGPRPAGATCGTARAAGRSCCSAPLGTWPPPSPAALTAPVRCLWPPGTKSPSTGLLAPR